MTQSTLPQELIESIIDELGHEDDTEALKQCSLVSRAFVYQSQRYLFRAIDLDRRLPRKKYYQRFHRLIGTRPHIGEHVRELRLGDNGEDDFDGSDVSWISSTKTLPHSLQLLPRLESFSLTFNSELTPWKSLPADLRSSIGRLFRLPTLHTVALEFITAFPPQLLMSLGQMRTLSLSCVEVDPMAPLPADTEYMQSRWGMALENLFLRGTSPATISVIASALGSATSPTLRRLTVTPTFESGFSDAIGELIKQSGENLKTFEWLPSIHFASSAGPIYLASLPHLRSLRFAVSFRRTHANGPFPEVLRLLGQLSHEPNSIESIIIDCHCVRVGDKIATEWRPLDKVLSKPAFDALKQIRVRLSTSTTSAMERHKFTLAFQDLLPMLQSKGTEISVMTLADIPAWCE
ncbi:hypothetical protein BDN70DRAFT_908536 [Pholiota conissans]|uniref:F-box domain-containing protein n=1 Tax=Pholiota conissans TaxID=109636 RepID=A0A9P6CP82_9AGAR|nr:hypothetical protein BDN70DRAFT_908536 [Pholiota conissans]